MQPASWGWAARAGRAHRRGLMEAGLGLAAQLLRAWSWRKASLAHLKGFWRRAWARVLAKGVRGAPSWGSARRVEILTVSGGSCRGLRLRAMVKTNRLLWRL